MIITKLGRATINVEEKDETDEADGATTMRPSKQEASDVLGSKAASSREGSKIAEVISLLSRKGGASIEELISATGWLPHTTRAALTGLRKRGYAVERARPEKSEASIYRIMRSSAQSQAA